VYNIGDKIVYPMHGAGVIEAIEEKMILGKKQTYYIMRMNFTTEMTVMIPTNTCDEIGVRYVIDSTEGAKVLEAFRKEEIVETSNWNRRQRENLQKVKSGDIYQVLSVVKELMYRDKQKGLSTSERKMLNNARQIMITELMLSKVADRDDIECILDDTVDELIKA